MREKTSPNAQEFRICGRCEDAWVENPGYKYCPDCMNWFYNSRGLPRVEWKTLRNGVTVGMPGCCDDD